MCVFQEEVHKGEESRNWGAQWLANGIIDVCLSAPSGGVNYQCRTILENNFLRVEDETPNCDWAIDSVSGKNIEALKQAGDVWFEKFGEKAIKLLEG